MIMTIKTKIKFQASYWAKYARDMSNGDDGARDISYREGRALSYVHLPEHCSLELHNLVVYLCHQLVEVDGRGNLHIANSYT